MKVSFNLDFSSSDLYTLLFALRSSLHSKMEVLDFYEANPDQTVMTPIELLRGEIDALERMIHIFQHDGNLHV